ncbi:hypothetical protein [Acidihalobacter prosperus]
MNKLPFFAVILLLALQLSGCALLVAGAAGGAAGYEAHKHGYTFRSPVTKQHEEDKNQ